MTADQWVSFARLMLYLILVFGLYLLSFVIRRACPIFLTLSLWLVALALTLILRLLKADALYAFVVNDVVTPLLALLAVSVWWTLWQERKQI